MRNRLVRWLAIASIGLGILALGFNGVPAGHPLTGFVTFIRVVAITAIVIACVLTLLALFVPGFRNIVRRRIFKTSGAGLSKEERAELSKYETKALASMRRTHDWAVIAGLTRSGLTSRGREFITSPGLIACELNARGPAVRVQIVNGSLPSDYTAERVSAALGLQVECEPSGPAQVRVQLLSRDPFNGSRDAQAVANVPVAPEAPIVLTDWTDIDPDGVK